MSTEANQKLMRRYYEDLWHRGDVSAVDEIVTADFVDHDQLPGLAPDREGLKQAIQAITGGMTQDDFKIDDLIEEGDKVVGRWTMRGRHTGDLLGVPPSGKPFTLQGIDIVRVQGGKIAETWHLEDILGLLQQIGAIPVPA